MEIHKFPYNWKLAEANFTKDKGKVFSCFACGGGSTMGYKLAGFDVIGCNEIDPKVNQVYVTNHAPRFNFLGDIRETTVEMAQESIDYFIQMAKYYAKAEKDLEVQKWVFVNFERKDGHSYVRLFSYDLPREVFERRKWVIDWRKARLVCQYPKDDVRYTLHFYDKRLGLDIRLNEDLRRLISAKAQVTKVQRKIDKYVAYNKAHNLFSMRVPIRIY